MTTPENMPEQNEEDPELAEISALVRQVVLSLEVCFLCNRVSECIDTFVFGEGTQNVCASCRKNLKP